MLGEVTGFWTYIWLRRESLSLYLANDALEASVRGRDAGAAHAVLLSADKLRQRVIREFERGYREFRVEGITARLSWCCAGVSGPNPYSLGCKVLRLSSAWVSERFW